MRFKIVMSKLQLVVKEGEILPSTHGIAYWKWETAEAVCYPLPFNLIVGRSRSLWIWMRRKHYMDEIERAYLKGREVGIEHQKQMQRVEVEAARYEGTKKGMDPEIRRAITDITGEILQQLRRP
jgi:hypothetical protein